jgi:2-phospho-L-lactate transferase/gluconeogenesis factor (CofD/UPF0052 family)
MFDVIQFVAGGVGVWDFVDSAANYFKLMHCQLQVFVEVFDSCSHDL